MKKILIIKLLWFIACLTILLNFYTGNHEFANKEAIITFTILMFAVTFPAGYLVWTLFYFKSMVAPGAIISHEVDIAIRWIGFVGVGYFQWFYVLPKIAAFIKKYLNRRTAVGGGRQ